MKPSYAYTMDNVPEGTTHVWKKALNKPVGFSEPLAFFRIEEEAIEVYSRHTGWRVSRNTSEWFLKEREEGFLLTLEEARKKVLDKS